ncbi:hypothetical protein ZWY2020_039791 [Hordeum vulgare]|nr:hypothetical protein ZWY2020_039791 [Hordeum vulgare]
MAVVRQSGRGGTAVGRGRFKARCSEAELVGQSTVGGGERGREGKANRARDGTGQSLPVVGGTSAENEGSKKVKKKKIKKKEDFCGFKMRFNSKRLEFKYKNKSIKFSKNMVKRIFNVPSGDSPMKLLKKSDERDLRSIYKEGNRAPIAHVFKLLRDCSDTDEAMIRRTWALVALAIVACPGTDNMVNLEYLPSLENMDLVHNLAWDEHLLARAMEEVAVFQEKKRGQATIENPKEFQIGSCLPMLAIIYMDHLDIPPSLPNEHVIDYSVPRIRYVCQKDFDWVDKVDKNKITLVQPFYGKHTQFRTLCNTPYAEVIGPEVDREAATGQGAGAEATNGQGSQNEVPEAQENVEVPAQFQTLYDKHKENFSTEIDDAIRKFGQSLKRLQSSRMASMLRDVGDAIANTTDEDLEKAKDAQDEAATPTMDEAREKEKDAQDEAEAATPPMDEAREKEKDAQAATSCIVDQAEGTVAVMSKDEVVGEMEKNQEVAEDAGQTREQQRVSMEVEVHVPPQSPPLFHDAPRSATTSVWDDEPSCELFPKGSEDFNLMHGMDEHTNNNKTCSNLYPKIHVFPASDDDGNPTIPGMLPTFPIDVGSGPSTHAKNTRKKRMAKVPAVKPKGKKQKVEVKEDKVKAIYEKYITHGKPLRRTPFIKIGGFYVGYKKFLASLNPRGDMNDEVMSLCIERLNMASYATHNRAVKKYFLSVYGASLLKQDPSIFQPNALMAQLERVVTKFKVQKYDLLWFAVVHERHWIVVCENLLHKQWNAFDSISSKGKPLTLKKQANNLITNFTTLTQECDAFNVNVASFTRADLEDYPKKNNLCDCGFFAVKYAEKFDGKGMKGFEQEDIARYRMEWAYNLIHHPLNRASMELAFREELAD